YRMFYGKVAVVDGKYDYIEGKLITDKNKQIKIVCPPEETYIDGQRFNISPTYDPLTKDQFADAINNGFILKVKTMVNGEDVMKKIP
ncbi:MAG: hypothetical protein WC389_14265, partial [Lutibacter sp.]